MTVIGELVDARTYIQYWIYHTYDGYTGMMAHVLYIQSHACFRSSPWRSKHHDYYKNVRKFNWNEAKFLSHENKNATERDHPKKKKINWIQRHLITIQFALWLLSGQFELQYIWRTSFMSRNMYIRYVAISHVWKRTAHCWAVRIEWTAGAGTLKKMKNHTIWSQSTTWLYVLCCASLVCRWQNSNCQRYLTIPYPIHPILPILSYPPYIILPSLSYPNRPILCTYYLSLAASCCCVLPSTLAGIAG